MSAPKARVCFLALPLLAALLSALFSPLFESGEHGVGWGLVVTSMLLPAVVTLLVAYREGSGANSAVPWALLSLAITVLVTVPALILAAAIACNGNACLS